MIYLKNIDEFFKKNLDDIRRMIRHISYPRLLSEPDLQERVSAFYLYCYNSKLLDRYDDCKGAISSYIYRGIRFTLFNQKIDTHHYVDITECTISYQIHYASQLDLESFINTLCDIDRDFIRDILNGLNNYELSKKYQCSVQNIYLKRWKLRDKWKAFSK